MTRRIAYALLAAILLLLVAAQGASAATSAQIHRDAADGYIDGNYTLAELRAANRTAPAELVEYGGWIDAYNDALRRLSNPDAPPTVAPKDENQDGVIDATEKAEAVKKTQELRKKKKTKQVEDAEATPSAEECDSDATDDNCVAASDDTAKKDDGNDGDDDGGSPLIWLIAGLPILIVAIGAWRMLRRKKPGGPPSDPRSDGSVPGPGTP